MPQESAAIPTQPKADARARLKRLIEQEAISIVFQPIVDLRDARVVGCEALTRPAPESGFDGPAILFELAEEFGMLEDIERIARVKIFQAASQFDPSLLLFFNNSPPIFTSDKFVEEIAQEVEYHKHLQFNRIVLEVTERTSTNLISDLDVRALLLREMGFQVAIDDVGAGVSGLNQIMSLRPNWIKLDRELISHIDYDPLKQNLIRTFVRFSRFSNIGLIAEGVERQEELNTLIDLGVTHAQGFFLARPAQTPQELDENLKAIIRDSQQQAAARTREDLSAVRMASLVAFAPTYDLKTTVGEVRSAMHDRVHHNGVVALDGRRCVGWISPADLNMFVDHSDDEVTLSKCPRKDNVVADHFEVLPEVLEMIASRPEHQQSLPVIVQKEGEVIGLAPLRNILRAAARTNRHPSTRYEPLTGLPSRVNADVWMAEHIRSNDPVDVAFIDLYDFDAYNQSYGTELGDVMLLCVAGILRDLAETYPDRVRYMAHLGGDRFLIAGSGDFRDLMREFIDRFEQRRSEFFSTVDLAASAFKLAEANGGERTIPLTTLRVIYLQKPLQQFAFPREVHELASKLRRRRRAVGENWDPIITDRRTRPALATRASA